MLNGFCCHDLSDEDSNYCSIYGNITHCPFPCKYCERGEEKDEDNRTENSAE